MIEILNQSQETPYLIFKDRYEDAKKASQKNIEAICISSYSKSRDEVSSRFVNLKKINDKNFIFFSNYNSPKAQDFADNSKISAVFFWNNTNVQIRLKAVIKKTPDSFNKEYFKNRDKNKNALAISSKQSKLIDSFKSVKENYNESLINDDLSKCPNYWGGFSFKPYYFEFWEGHISRLNQRDVYEMQKGRWIHNILQP
jgi:pyridoxamine 5'-phosphate oxidase